MEDQSKVPSENNQQIHQENYNFKILIPQIQAAIVTGCFHFFIGRTIVLTIVLVSQLSDDSTNHTTTFTISKSESIWITNALIVPGMASILLSGILIDSIGRLNSIMLGAIPGVIGLFLIATAVNLRMVITGSVTIGFAIMLLSNGAVIYVNEISRPDIRSVLVALMIVFTGLGMLVTFLEQTFLNWRSISWISVVYLILPMLHLRSIRESASWLVLQESFDKAKDSLVWFNKYIFADQKKVNSLMDLDVSILESGIFSKGVHGKSLVNGRPNNYFDHFQQPEFYRPWLILIGIHCFQMFSNIAVINKLADLFKTISPSLGLCMNILYICTLKLLFGFVSLWVIYKYPKRTILLSCLVSVTVVMITAGLLEQFLPTSTSVHNWIQLGLTLICFALTLMILIVLFTIGGEVFPIEIRGVAYSFYIISVNLVLFIVYECYGVVRFKISPYNQFYFCAATSVVNILHIYVFLPETKSQKLLDIVKHFKYYLYSESYRKNHYLCKKI